MGRLSTPPVACLRPVWRLLDRTLDLAARLSAPFDFIRVGLYATVTGLRVGELTNCSDAG